MVGGVKTSTDKNCLCKTELDPFLLISNKYLISNLLLFQLIVLYMYACVSVKRPFYDAFKSDNLYLR